MKTTAALITSAAATIAAALPSTSVLRRGTFCDDWGSETAGPYTVFNNLWGKDSADSGEQCTTNNGMSGDSLSWAAEWSWAGGPYSVKSYPNAVVEIEQAAISGLSSIPTEWTWSYTGTDVVANVAYDLFTGTTPDGDHTYEFMIWLGALGGAGPISSTGSPIATPDVAGHSWNLYEGLNGEMNVFSFVASSNIESFSGDLIEFVNYLVENQGVGGDQILQSVGAGTEPFLGSNAVFTTSSYSASVSY
jgi:xyloglucan-specific endo-beta-1,4-glucanase